MLTDVQVNGAKRDPRWDGIFLPPGKKIDKKRPFCPEGPYTVTAYHISLRRELPRRCLLRRQSGILPRKKLLAGLPLSSRIWKGWVSDGTERINEHGRIAQSGYIHRGETRPATTVGHCIHIRASPSNPSFYAHSALRTGAWVVFHCAAVPRLPATPSGTALRATESVLEVIQWLYGGDEKRKARAMELVGFISFFLFYVRMPERS